ncbi:MAG: Cna B-type protein [Acidobacteriaceae bacterium]|nr:Cna B-type protein [Acidobacteriaceae bacterium]
MKKAVSFSALLVVALLCGLWTSRASAQAVYGSIFGTVTDPQGAAVNGAKVTVTDKNKGTTEQTTTNESGNYSVTHLIPDPYSVKVDAQGFKGAEQQEVTVSADTGAKVDLALQLGSASESVEVTSEAPQLKTDRADVATTFNETYVQDLPIINRNFTQIELLSPGAQYLGWGHAATENPQGSEQIMVNGQHFSGTGYELDGTDNQDPILGIIVVNPNIDAITETKITTADYDAEFGKAVAGLVTVQTKSGTNALHGGAFWFRRTDATEAHDPFHQFRTPGTTGKIMPQDRWNQFGGTIGGPIIKDKLFFFGDYQGTRQASGSSYSLTLPTALVHKSCIGPGDGSGFCKLDQYTSLIGSGAGGLIYDPNSSNPLSDPKGSSRTAFCGPAGCATQPNWIPLNRVDPVAQKILGLLPLPTDPTALQQNYSASGSGPYTQNSFDTRIDFNASQSLQVFGRFSLARFSLSGKGLLGPMGGVGTGQLGLAGSAVTHNYSLASGFTKTLSSSLLTDFRFGYFKYNPTTHKPDEGKDAAKALGLGGLNFGDLFTSGLPLFDGLGPAINAGSDQGTFAMGDGLNVARCNCPLIESEQQFQFVNNWTKMRGNHQFRFGGDIRYAENLRVPSDANRTGELHFTQDNNHANSGSTSQGGVGGSGFANFLLGDVNHLGRFVSSSTNAAERQKRWFFYGQDTWRVTSKLTVNYGLRWEIYFPESVNAKGNGGFANPVEGIIRIGGYGKYGLNGNINNSWKAFAPRLGVAYQFTPKTVVRLGYGRSFDMGVFGSNFGHAVTQNLPVLVNQQVNANNNGFATVDNNFNAAFTLAQGPPAYAFPPIPSNGILPLGGPANNVQPRMRPTFQRLPTLDAWNATVQHQLTNTMSLEVGYVANKGTHVFAGNGPSYDLNMVPYGPGSAKVTVAGQAPGFTAVTPSDQRRRFNNFFTYPGFIDPSTNAPLKCCTDGIMGNYFGNDANAHYNSLQIKLDKRFTQGLQFMSSYVFSHATNQSTDGGYLYAVDPRQSTGPDDFNRNHMVIFNGVYQLPFGRGKAFLGDSGRAMNLIIGGWQLGDTVIWGSGLPWTANLNGSDCGQVSDTGPCLPNFKGSFHVGASSFDKSTHKVTYYTPVSPLAYPTAALTVNTDTCTLARPTSGPFSMAACGTGGNVGRNSFRGPGTITDNLSLSKTFQITERFNTEFRMDTYNLFNHPNLANPNSCVDCTDSNAGKITGLAGSTSGISNNGMRYLQFGLKIGF